jgi:DNA-binding transcriptional LysR family regulator
MHKFPDEKKMDLNQLQMFAAVAEFGNLTQAAERLHISQPAASAQIKQLEEEFKILLFERKSSGLTLTRAGSVLLPTIQQLLANANQVKAQARGLSSQVTGVIKFAVVASIVDKSFPQIAEVINRILTCHPLLDVELHHGHALDIKLGIAHGEFDAALVIGTRNVPDLRRIYLQDLYYRIVASEVWRNRVGGASQAELACLPWVLCPGTQHEMVQELFKEYEPRKIVKANSQELINSLVTAGAGLGLMPEDGAIEAEAAGKVFIVNDERVSTQLQFAHRVGRENDPAIQTIFQVLEELWPNQCDLAPAAEHAAWK